MSPQSSVLRPQGRQPSLLLGGVHLAVLWAFAFQQPLLELLGRNADFFVVRGNTRGDIITYAVLFTVLPPLAMVAAEWVALRVRRNIYEGLHLTLVGALGAALALQLLKDNIASGPALLLILVAIGLGVLAAKLYRDTVFAPQALTVLTPAPLLFLIVFLFFSPVHKLILPQKEAEAVNIEVKSTTPVVVLIVDEWPTASLMDSKGQIDASLFPNFAKLAKESTWYRNTTSVAGFTTRAVPAILTAKDPGDSLPISSDQPDSIFTLLGGTYKMNVDETATSICPPKLCGGKEVKTAGGTARAPKQDNGRFRTRMHQLVSDLFVVSEHLLLPNSIAAHLPAVDQTFGDFGGGGGGGGGGGSGNAGSGSGKGGGSATSGNAQQVKVGESLRKGAFTNRPEKFASFVDSIADTPQTLNLLHIVFPHFPWLYLPNGKRYVPKTPDLALNDGVWPDDLYYVHYGQQRHFLQANLVDSELGDLIAKMKMTGLWDKAIFVVVADHGSSFIPNEKRRDPTGPTMGEIAEVPLFVKEPGQRKGKVDDAHRCTTDVVPIIARTLGVRVPWRTYQCADDVTVAAYNGKPVRLSLDEVLPQRQQAVDRKIATFGEGTGIAGLYRFGPHPELIGKSVGATPSAPGGGVSVKLLGDFDYSPSGETIPALVQGELKGIKPGEALAVAVNGKIVTTGQAFHLLGKIRVAASLPAQSLKPGANSVEVLRIIGSGGGLRLQPLGGS
jgi:sulfatase-like protein